MSQAGVLYMAYASCMNKGRLGNSVKDPQKVSNGKLEGYRLEFAMETPKWHGALACVVPSAGDHVWGVIWRVSQEDMDRLFIQEGVNKGILQAREVDLTSPVGDHYKAFILLPAKPEEVPRGGQPSPQYKAVVLEGAEANDLPEEYIQKLRDVQDNGYQGETDMSGANF